MTPDTTVCVVDDDASVRRALQRLLSLNGYRVDTFASWDEFLNRPASLRVDCLVLDVRMPEESGLTLCEILARRGRHLPTVLITGERDSETALRSIHAGAIDLLIKPLDVDVLCESVARAVDMQASRPAPPPCHGVVFYKDDRSLAVTAAEFLDEGIRFGHAALIIATPAHAAAIGERLRTLGHDLGALAHTGTLHVLDARTTIDTFTTDGVPDPLRFKHTTVVAVERMFAGRPARVYGEGVDLLWQDGHREGAIKLERLWDSLAAGCHLTTLCGYSVRHFANGTHRYHNSGHRNVCAVHSHVVPATLTWA